MDLFTNTATILNKLYLGSITGCPGDMSTFSLVFTSTFWHFFVKFSYNKTVIRKKIVVLSMFASNNDSFFPEKQLYSERPYF